MMTANTSYAGYPSYLQQSGAGYYPQHAAASIPVQQMYSGTLYPQAGVHQQQQVNFQAALSHHASRMELERVQDNAHFLYSFAQYHVKGGNTKALPPAMQIGSVAPLPPSSGSYEEAVGRAEEIVRSLKRWMDITIQERQKTLQEEQLLESSKYKKRSRAAGPGRCHSCNIAETPEWRRGPDGARTLCNACGLHYAKVSKKQKQAQEEATQPAVASAPRSAADEINNATAPLPSSRPPHFGLPTPNHSIASELAFVSTATPESSNHMASLELLD